MISVVVSIYDGYINKQDYYIDVKNDTYDCKIRFQNVFINEFNT